MSISSKELQWEVTGQFKSRDGSWSDITVTIKASNDRVARVRATEYMHIIKKVKQV